MDDLAPSGDLPPATVLHDAAQLRGTAPRAFARPGRYPDGENPALRRITETNTLKIRHFLTNCTLGFEQQAATGRVGGLTLKTVDRQTDLYIVDDDDLMRETLSVMFTDEGYTVHTFADGESFLAAARERLPSCVLLDVKMPGRSGIDVLKELDAQHYGAPIFMISGQGDIPLAVEAIKNGAFDFIEKPFAVD